MDIWLVLLVFVQISTADDIFQIFKPNSANSKELNDFLANLLKHKDDFNLIKRIAQDFHKKKKFADNQETTKTFNWNLNLDDNPILNRETRRVGGRKSKNKWKKTNRSRRYSKENEENVRPQSENGVIDVIGDNLVKKEIGAKNEVHKTILKDSKIPTNKRQSYIDNEGFEQVKSFEIIPGEFSLTKAPQYRDLSNTRLLRDESHSNRKRTNFGNGFIKIFRNPNSPNDNVNNNNNAKQGSYIFPYRLRRRYSPRKLRKVPRKYRFKVRRLQFFDERMLNDDNGKDDYPGRLRRDFSQVLGMKNEDDYSEDNPYLEDMSQSTNCTTETTTVNNDKLNDIVSNVTLNDTLVVTTSTTETCADPESLLEEDEASKEETEATTQSSKSEVTTTEIISTTNCTKVRKSIKDFDDVVENRIVRAADYSKKILDNKSKIYNHYYNPYRFRRHKIARKKRKKVNHRINKKQDTEVSFSSEEAMDIPEETVTPTKEVSLTTEFDVNDEARSFSVTEGLQLIQNTEMDLQQDNMATMVDGNVAVRIVSLVFDQVTKSPVLKKQFGSSLSRKYSNYAGSINFNLLKTNISNEEVFETKYLIEQISKVLNKVIANEVNGRLCQKLPNELREVLEKITGVESEDDFERKTELNSKQDDFLFNTNDFGSDQKKFHLKDLKDDMENLLRQFKGMNSDCQEQTIPVKEFIENHLKILTDIMGCENSVPAEVKRDTPFVLQSDLIEKQLESVGLGKKPNFHPNFDLDEIVRSKINPSRKIKRETKKTTDKYKKLQRAAEQMRQKRDSEEKIGELFGNQRQVDNDFEMPVVYSL